MLTTEEIDIYIRANRQQETDFWMTHRQRLTESVSLAENYPSGFDVVRALVVPRPSGRSRRPRHLER
jgi:hypothetical protein